MGTREEIKGKICGLRLFWISLFVLTTTLLIATIVGFALVGWSPQTPEFAILSFNFTFLLIVESGVAGIFRICNKRKRE